MNFINRIITLVLSSLEDVIIKYVKDTGNGKTNQWQTLVIGLLPMIFSYLDAPIHNGINGALSNNEKFQKAINMVNKAIGKYVNFEVLQDDIIALVQLKFNQWKTTKRSKKTNPTQVVLGNRTIKISDLL